MSTIVLRRTAGIGDAVCATAIADALAGQGHEIVFQTHRSIIPVIQRNPNISSVTERDSACHVDLDGVYENHPDKKTVHLQDMFTLAAGRKLYALGIHFELWSKAPTLCTPPQLQTAMAQKFRDHERPWTFICPRSEHYNVRSVPDTTWAKAAMDIPGSKFWLGRSPAPRPIVDLHVQTITQAMDNLAAADLLLTTDTGPMHIAAAMGIPLVVIMQAVDPRLRLPSTAVFEEVHTDLSCLNCQLYECPVNRFIPPCQNVSSEKISLAAQKLLASAVKTKSMST